MNNIYTRSQLLEFYNGTNYSLVNAGSVARPSDLHIPYLLSKQTDAINDAIKLGINDNKIVVPVLREDCKALAPVLLHESLFHFYKAFYNYLAARSLYFGGMLHWIVVTLYYSRFYLARSITTMLCLQTYQVNRQVRYDMKSHFFDERISNVLKSTKPVDHYRIRIEIDIKQNQGQITFDRNKVSSHKDVWDDYESLDLQSVGIYPVTYDIDDMKAERNEENYTFEGYYQLDFNLPTYTFKDFFQRDGWKADANRLYESESANVLLSFSSLFRLYKEFNIKNLPIEPKKFTYLIDYCLPDSQLKNNLLMLCNEGFPTESLNFNPDYEIFYDEKGRDL